MKAVRIHEDGGPEVLRYEDADDPVAGPGEVLIRLRAASLNHLDIWTRQGLPSRSQAPDLGADGAGVVEALGEDTDGFATGDAVVINPASRTAHTSSASTPTGPTRSSSPSRLTTSIRSPTALLRGSSRVPLVFETAYRMLVTRANLGRTNGCSSGAPAAGVASAALCALEGAWRPRDRHVVERREARACAGGGRRRQS